MYSLYDVDDTTIGREALESKYLTIIARGWLCVWWLVPILTFFGPERTWRLLSLASSFSTTHYLPTPNHHDELALPHHDLPVLLPFQDKVREGGPQEVATYR